MQGPSILRDIDSSIHGLLALGQLDQALALADTGHDPEHLNSHGLTAGQWAFGFLGPSSLDRLFQKGWVRPQSETWANGAASLALSADNAPALGWLLQKGYDPNTCVQPKTLVSCLAKAVGSLAINCFDLLVAAGANTRVVDKMAHGLLHFLASSPCTDTPDIRTQGMLDRCLSMGLDINLRDDLCHDTPAAMAAFNHNIHLLMMFAERGSDLHARNKVGYGLVHAACQGSPDPMSGHVVCYLLDRGVDIQTPAGTHPVHFAAARDNPHALRALWARGIPLEMPLCDNQGQTPVYTAMCSASTEALRFLMDAGVDCNVVDRRGCGLLHLACGRQRISHPAMQTALRDLVIAKGLDPDTSSNMGQTPLLHAAQEGSVQAMKAMLDLGATPTAVCLVSCNLLHYVAQQPNPSPARLAVMVAPVEYRSRPDIHGRVPHDLAHSMGNHMVGDILEAAWSSSALGSQTHGVLDDGSAQRRL